MCRSFFNGMPAVSIQPPSHHSLLFQEPITQKQKTQPLRDWILTHRKHPYPSRDEKLGLAMATHMRVDQVTMWFANTRRQIRRIGMKAWSGGVFDTELPYRVGNGGTATFHVMPSSVVHDFLFLCLAWPFDL